MRRIALLVVALGASLLPARPAAAVVGGEEADLGEWPWQVALLQDGSQVCGGSLIAMDLVITAAHCVDGTAAADLQVEAGTVDLGASGGVRRAVDEVVQHEDYDPVETTNDIALLRLDLAFEPSDDIAAVALPDPATADALDDGGAPVTVTGFGATDEDAEDTSDELLEAAVEVVADGTCTDEYAEEGEDVFGEQQVCAGLDEGGVDACFGDSGGPLVAPAGDGEDETWYLLGLVSWGDGCGRPHRPTVYTQVSAFTDWLLEHGAITSSAGERFASSLDEPLRLPAVGTRGKASHYPDGIDVSGVDDAGHVSVELTGLSHERPSDLDVWLVAPDGTTVTLLSDVGGDEPIADLDLVVDDGAPATGHPLPLRIAPTDVGIDRQLKRAQRPADLSVLEDVDPNGEWHLLVADDRGGASGTLEGWSIVFE
jgi:secreted trypsin-like serine protease